MSNKLEQATPANEAEPSTKATGRQLTGWLRPLFRELLPTFLGVLLAFYLNDQWVRSQEQQLLQQLQQTLRVELQENLERVEGQIAYHELMQDSAAIIASMYYQVEDKADLPSANFWRGIGASQLSDAAYLTTVSTQNMAKLDLPLVIAVASAYSAQRDYESVLESARQALLIKEWPDYLVWLNYMRWTASNLLAAEQEIIETHQHVLALLEE
ncbi:MAG: hypothetical protein AAF798_08235 [Bacteroidota bacterium]